MLKSMRITWLAGLLVALTTISPAQAQVKIGDAPPDLLGTTRDKHEVRISAYRGKVVVVSFWASWCPYCIQELPVLERLQQVLGKSRIEVIAVNIDRNRSDYLAMQRQLKNFQFTMVRDEYHTAADLYAVDGLPYLIMIGKTGRVSHLHKGYSEKALDGFVAKINALLDEPEAIAAAPAADG
jgi:thiol-disulfide isomerase/thioredoxin